MKLVDRAGYITVKALIEKLEKLVEENPECGDQPVLVQADDTDILVSVSGVLDDVLYDHNTNISGVLLICNDGMVD